MIGIPGYTSDDEISDCEEHNQKRSLFQPITWEEYQSYVKSESCIHPQGNFPTPLSRALEDLDNVATIAVIAARPTTPKVMMRAKGVSVTTNVHFLPLSRWVDASSEAAYISVQAFPAKPETEKGGSHQDLQNHRNPAQVVLVSWVHSWSKRTKTFTRVFFCRTVWF